MSMTGADYMQLLNAFRQNDTQNNDNNQQQQNAQFSWQKALPALLGGGLGYAIHPQRAYQPLNVATLNAATLPQMQEDANMRIAQINSQQSAQGGMNSMDAYRVASTRAKMSQQIGQQRALNQAQAIASQNQASQVRQENQMGRIGSALAIGGALKNMFN